VRSAGPDRFLTHVDKRIPVCLKNPEQGVGVKLASELPAGKLDQRQAELPDAAGRDGSGEGTRKTRKLSRVDVRKISLQKLNHPYRKEEDSRSGEASREEHFRNLIRKENGP